MDRLTQAKIAEITGFHKPNISRWLRGDVVPTLATAKIFSEKTGIPMDVFYSRATQARYLGKIYLRSDAKYRAKGYEVVVEEVDND